MLKLFNKYRHLTFEQKRTLLIAWLQFIKWHVFIAYVPFRYWRKTVFNQIDIQNAPNAHLQAIKITRWVEAAARHHFVAINCLRRCMVQKYMLTINDIHSQICIGVKKEQNVFKAHCWLIVNNHIINDSNEETSHYVELKRLDNPQQNQTNPFQDLQ